MEAAYLSAIAVLAGSTLGGLTSIATSWLSQHVQFRTRLQAADLRKREELYSAFIEEASRTYGHALEHDAPNAADLVHLYALTSRMRVRSSPQIVDSADAVVHAIIDTYLAPNKTLRDVRAALAEDAIDPLRPFADACREEFTTLQAVVPRRPQQGRPRERRVGRVAPSDSAVRVPDTFGPGHGDRGAGSRRERS